MSSERAWRDPGASPMERTPHRDRFPLVGPRALPPVGRSPALASLPRRQLAPGPRCGGRSVELAPLALADAPPRGPPSPTRAVSSAVVSSGAVSSATRRVQLETAKGVRRPGISSSSPLQLEPRGCSVPHAVVSPCVVSRRPGPLAPGGARVDPLRSASRALVGPVAPGVGPGAPHDSAELPRAFVLELSPEAP